ncbi:cyclin-dependent kinase inhibitor far1 [Podila verticillata]|nr:cyclin-dependent kinase inhibitor far1 [Podila verticillata]
MEFYTENNVIFLTGGTGFVGKTLLEKILRSLPQIKKIYLLLRATGDEMLQGRVDQEIFGSRLFDTLKTQYNNENEFYDKVVKKIVPVQGDISLERLGMSERDLEMIQRDTTVLVHSAASVSLMDPLNVALELNTRGSLRTFDVARTLPLLKSLVHISTAYVNSPLEGQRVLEQIYPFQYGNPEEIWAMLSAMSSQQLDVYAREVVLKVHPNTYTFAKSLTEHLIQTRFRDMNLPMVIVRPTMVGAAISEPIAGWTEGLSSCNGLILATALGVAQEWEGDENKTQDVIPVDMLCKSILMSALKGDRTLPGPPVFHVGTSGLSGPIGILMCNITEQYWQAVPPPALRVSNDIRINVVPSKHFKEHFQQRFSEDIEAMYGTDRAKAKRAQKKLARIYMITTLYKYFQVREWFFDASNAMALDEIAPLELRARLSTLIDWIEYGHNYNLGVHEFILNESVDRSLRINYKFTPRTLPFVPTQQVASAASNRSDERNDRDASSQIPAKL